MTDNGKPIPLIGLPKSPESTKRRQWMAIFNEVVSITLAAALIWGVTELRQLRVDFATFRAEVKAIDLPKMSDKIDSIDRRVLVLEHK
jgi:ferric-dicitrate binding protein FerR (iron transport regulator)